MNVQEIYDKYSIPINLQQHMLRVAAIGSLICDHLKIEIDKELVVKTLLLHDMGNILKFDFSKTNLMVEADLKRIDELIAVQESFKEEYGNNPDDATLAIIREATSDEQVARLCEASHWENAAEFLGTDLWETKIACYSDMKIGPFGVVELKDRFDDLEVRRPHERERLKVLRQQGYQLEKEIQEVTKIDLQEISDETIAQEIEEVKQVSF